MDDVTFEIMRHRLWEINNGIGVLAARMAASPAVYETGDYNTGILTADGKGLFSGVGVIRMATALDLVVQSVRDLFGDDVGPGDVFLTNDPYAGALHAMDVAVVAPVFAGDRLVSWTGIVFHELDMGGPTPGSWSVGARDAYQEAPLLPPIKVVAGGVVRQDVEALFLRNSRTPNVIGVNLHAKIGAQYLAQARIQELIEELGVEEFFELQRRILEDVTNTVRAELRRIPDGEWTVTTFLDHDGISDSIYELKLCAKKSGEKLILDFTGTSAQAPGPINCARSGLVAGVLEVLVPAFCIDVPWAHGAVADCIEIISEEGTINNARHPAPTSMATVNGCQATSDLVWQALSRMTGWVPERRDEAIALGYGGVNSGVLSGRFASTGAQFVASVSGLGGGAARWGSDGVDSGGNIIAPIFAIPNIERLESLAPVLYVWRRERPDSAGAGQWRGGLGVEIAITPHRADGPLTGVTFSTSWAAPAARGAYGGMPGGLQSNVLLDGVSLSALLSSNQLFAHDDDGVSRPSTTLPGKALFALHDQQLWISVGSGGGGLGDPLLREPELVARDVADGTCSPAHARAIYGVRTTDHGRLDRAGTDAARADIRRQRLGPAEAASGPVTDDAQYAATGHTGRRGLFYDYDSQHAAYRCHACGTYFTFGVAGGGVAPEGSQLVHHARWALLHVTAVNAWAGDYGFTLEASTCPGCGQQHAVEVIWADGSLPEGTTEHLVTPAVARPLRAD
jgi:N-methylhydantoinase B